MKNQDNNQDNNQDKDLIIIDAGNVMDALRICDSKGFIVGYFNLDKKLSKGGFKKVTFAQDHHTQDSDELRACSC